MNARTRLAALLAAGSLVLAISAVTSAAPPTYGIDLEKAANPAVVPTGGGSVVYTVTVTPTGTGFFGTVTVDDGMTGCTLSAATGDTDTDGNLDPGETWAYTCTVNGVTPGTQNTATVHACHNGSGACNQATQDAADTDTITVDLGPDITSPPATEPPATQPPATQPPATQPPATQPPATQPPATQPPSTGVPTEDPNPTSDVADDVDATMPSSDIAKGGDLGAPSSQSWLLVLALGMLLASIVIATPARTTRDERE